MGFTKQETSLVEAHLVVSPMYPIVNIQKTMDNHHFVLGKLTTEMAMFYSYVRLTEGMPGYDTVDGCKILHQ